jgi:lipopolysaccharide transport system ATP-binding protein
MSQSAIIVENLSKRYLIGHRHTQPGRYKYMALRDEIGRGLRNFVRKAAEVAHGSQVVQGDEVEEFWALRDVSFEVKEGEVLGIIGRNGAGKSTLLKILSRITEPTEGRVLLRGRVASLLEVGTGFHPELTGRENIFLNGAILGMTQREIRRKFDEIVAFAEVERFLDTPVKHYSSGMYVRLAFAVAAHLEPEVLIIDEVLAVGDAKFQTKCLEKIRNVATDGRTILFVSHNMATMSQLTSRAVFLSQGAIECAGKSSDVIDRYLRADRETRSSQYDVGSALRRHYGTGDVKMLFLRFERESSYFNFLEPIRYVVAVEAQHSVDRLRVGMTVVAEDGSAVGTSFSREMAGLSKGETRELIVELAPVRLAPGSYSCNISIGCGNDRTSLVDYDIVLDTLYFEVGPDKTSFGSLASWPRAAWGSISFPDLAIEPKRGSRMTIYSAQ